MGNEPVIVLDTHALVWWLTGGSALSHAAKQAIAEAAQEAPVVVSAISILEIVTAVRRGRLQFARLVERWLADAHLLPELCFAPVSAEIAQLAGSLGQELHGDPADRIIAATAIILGCSLVTADEKLRTCRALTTVW
ncbi:Ribonuclease VapC [Candidatus Accumulibacter aalborgensis]|uniref:Ribonuclease VapC n=1 Tax=Candidatus Accumulibacter aalborgensis TaxID=1860102 RepID=A0A1A8XZ49_9PROT|nr:Ribonuclease VapC [Candidatus Accumulibacter aalborgensis]